jgi:hypothetical protein
MERVLVCLLGSTRSHQLTFPSFKQHVLDELNADLALALVIGDRYDYSNPLWQHAKYRWTAPDFADYGEAFDRVQRCLCEERNIQPPDWRILLRVKGIWQGRIKSSDPQPSASSILPFSRWLLLRNLQQDGVLDRYDRFVITRSDFLWLCPHPPLSILDRNALWFPDGEHWDGINDRHLVVSRKDVVSCLNGIEDILFHPEELYEDLKDRECNDEAFLRHHLTRRGILDRAEFFPYVMYAARATSDDSPTWSSGRYEPASGHFVKYESEFRSARAFATIIRSRADWESGRWRQFRPELAALPQVSMPRRLWHVCKSLYYKFTQLLDGLSRTGRRDRLVRYVARITHRSRLTITQNVDIPLLSTFCVIRQLILHWLPHARSNRLVR